jgi:hypothetical protein
MSEIFEPVRRIVADAVRSRVVGPNADNRAQELFEAPGERWFTEDRPIRIIHADSCMFIGGLRALLFQSLQPLAMAGVASHSDYKAPTTPEVLKPEGTKPESTKEEGH